MEFKEIIENILTNKNIWKPVKTFKWSDPFLSLGLCKGIQFKNKEQQFINVYTANVFPESLFGFCQCHIGEDFKNPPYNQELGQEEKITVYSRSLKKKLLSMYKELKEKEETGKLNAFEKFCQFGLDENKNSMLTSLVENDLKV